MRIESSGLSPTSASSSEKSAATSGAANAPSANAASAGTSGGEAVSLASDSGYVPSTELSNLTQRAQAEPRVRHHRIHEVAQKLAQGQYSTAASASKTASAILDGVD
jgi:Anti-sigma-28 factor, FlgM